MPEETATCLYCGHTMHPHLPCEAFRMIGVSSGSGDFFKGNREAVGDRPFTSVGGSVLRCQCRPVANDWNWSV